MAIKPFRQLFGALFLMIAAAVALGAIAAPATSPKNTKSRTSVSALMDYGPFLSYSVSRPRPAAAQAKRGPRLPSVPLAEKGITIDVGNGASVCFDTATLRLAAGWTGGFLDLSKTNIGGLKGDSDAIAPGHIQFSTFAGPGWARDKTFTEPRAGGYGPLPRQWAHYQGLYRHGKKVVLSYSVGDADVLEMPGSVAIDQQIAFTRTIRISSSAIRHTLLVCDLSPADGRSLSEHKLVLKGRPRGAGETLLLVDEENATAIGVMGAPAGTSLHQIGSGRVVLDLPAATAPATFKLVVETLPAAQVDTFSKVLDAASQIEDLPALCHGGPALWPAPTITQGRRARDSASYVVDTLTLPDENPSHSWMRPSGLDFFSDGRCAVCTLNGDVWIVSGLDASLNHLAWKRFAAGLYEPLGLKIINKEIYVLGRDQITRLHDLNHDGEADFYENFNNDQITSPIYHAFSFDLQVDSHGSFFYAVDGNAVPLKVPLHGCILKVSADGKKTEVYASGLRAANGTGMSPKDELVCSDNQGHWTPVCRINLVKPGGFYGYNGDPRVVTKAEIARQRKNYDVPLCWIPYEKDNSTGGQAYVTGNRWGPLKGLMLSTSYGKCKLFEVMSEEVDGIPQGASVELPLEFSSGIMRARANPVDGQLYVCGLKGWQTSASRDGCLQRVRYTGTPAPLPVEFHIIKSAITITFATPLDPKSANDEQNFGIEQWNYKWSEKYGSAKYKVSRPSEIGTDEVNIRSSKLMADGKTVLLEIPDLRPVMQLSIQVHLIAADGMPVECQIDSTINHLPGLSLPPILTAN